VRRVGPWGVGQGRRGIGMRCGGHVVATRGPCPAFPTNLEAMTDISTTDQWAAVEDLVSSIGDVSLRELFADDPERGRRMSITAGDLHIDLSTNRVSGDILAALSDLAHAAALPAQRSAMSRGGHISTTEDRPVLHTALRRPADAHLVVDTRDVVSDVHAVLSRMT